ncbi:MAG: class I SAM-dependent methyltransferase [Anaerolineae bacterium]
MLAPYPGATILDLGGGHGQIAEALIQRQYDVTVGGSDPVCAARLKPLVERDLCKFEVVDFLNLPFEDKSFGIVMSYRLLPHMIEWRRFIAEMTRVAQICVIVDYPEKQSINQSAPQLLRLNKQLDGNTHSYTSFDEGELLGEFDQHHFRICERYPEFFLPMMLHRTMKMQKVSESLERVSRRIGLTTKYGSPVILKLIRERQATRSLYSVL